MRKFARDVAVNVVANLIAALILYLLGTAVGLLPDPRGAVIAAVMSLIGLITGVGVITAADRMGKPAQAFTVMLLVGGSYTFLEGVAWPNDNMPIWLRILFALLGVFLIGCGAFVFSTGVPWGIQLHQLMSRGTIRSARSRRGGTDHAVAGERGLAGDECRDLDESDSPGIVGGTLPSTAAVNEDPDEEEDRADPT